MSAMNQSKTTQLEQAGWVPDETRDFLEMSRADVQLVELKMKLGEYMRDARRHRRWSQEQMAENIGSSLAQIIMMEAADPSISLDLMVKALLSMGASPRDIGRALAC